MHDNSSSAGLRAVFDRAGLPSSSYPAFREAIEAMREGDLDLGGAAGLKRRMVERVLIRCADDSDVDMAPLLTLLRQFSVEAAREEARMLCEELAVHDFIDPPHDRLAA